MLTGTFDNLGNRGRVVPFDCLPGCRGHSSVQPAFLRAEGSPSVVIVVSEVIGYCRLLMNPMALRSKAPRGVARYSPPP